MLGKIACPFHMLSWNLLLEHFNPEPAVCHWKTWICVHYVRANTLNLPLGRLGWRLLKQRESERARARDTHTHTHGQTHRHTQIHTHSLACTQPIRDVICPPAALWTRPRTQTSYTQISKQQTSYIDGQSMYMPWASKHKHTQFTLEPRLNSLYQWLILSTLLRYASSLHTHTHTHTHTHNWHNSTYLLPRCYLNRFVCVCVCVCVCVQRYSLKKPCYVFSSPAMSLFGVCVCYVVSSQCVWGHCCRPYGLTWRGTLSIWQGPIFKCPPSTSIMSKQTICVHAQHKQSWKTPQETSKIWKSWNFKSWNRYC